MTVFTIAAPSGVAVELTIEEYRAAAKIGFMRRFCAKSRNYRALIAGGDIDVATCWANVLGAISEFALSKYTGGYWHATIGQQKSETEPDVEPDYQARCRDHHGGKLVVRPRDRDSQRFVMLTSDDNGLTWYIRGWVFGFEAKRDEYLADPGGIGKPAWFVPFDKLRSMEKRRWLTSKRSSSSLA